MMTERMNIEIWWKTCVNEKDE